MTSSNFSVCGGDLFYEKDYCLYSHLVNDFTYGGLQFKKYIYGLKLYAILVMQQLKLK